MDFNLHRQTLTCIDIREAWGRSCRALASHHCERGSIPGFVVICELSLFLIVSLASRGFLPVLRLSSLRKNQQSIRIVKQRLFIYLFYFALKIVYALVPFTVVTAILKNNQGFSLYLRLSVDN
jgi:hypothetical protein